MKAKTLRLITTLAVIILISIGFIANVNIGTLSAFGWSDIVLLCPIGALGTMLATKLLIPQAIISLLFATLLIIIFGRSFCAWICPVPLLEKLRTIFKKHSSPENPLKKTALDTNTETLDSSNRCTNKQKSLTEAEISLLSTHKSKKCSTCIEKRGKIDSRHFILGGSLLSAAIFGFPVFCLICPIGLTFASIFLIIRLFTFGDVSWSIVIIPVVLIIEVVLYKKWCHNLCPLSAFMSLLGKLNKTFIPTVNNKTCLETTQEKTCGACAKVCPEKIDPRHPKKNNTWQECTRCRKCIESCPTKSITMPLFPKQQKNDSLIQNNTLEKQ